MASSVSYVVCTEDKQSNVTLLSIPQRWIKSPHPATLILMFLRTARACLRWPCVTRVRALLCGNCLLFGIGRGRTFVVSWRKKGRGAFIDEVSKISGFSDPLAPCLRFRSASLRLRGMDLLKVSPSRSSLITPDIFKLLGSYESSGYPLQLGVR